MRWDPRDEYKDLIKTARQAIHRKENQNEIILAEGVLRLIEQVGKDEQAINHVLDECGGHLTLATLQLYYEAHERTLKDWKKAAEKIIEDSASEKALPQAIDLCRLIAKRPL